MLGFPPISAHGLEARIGAARLSIRRPLVRVQPGSLDSSISSTKGRNVRRIFFGIVAGALALSACGDDPTGPRPPNLVGTYDGSWSVTVEGPGVEPMAEACPGAVSVTDQAGGAFEGTYTQAASEGCDAASGFVTGTVTSDGTVSMLLGASGGGGPGFEESTGCTLLSAEDRYTGSWTDGALEFETHLTALCPETGDVTVTWTYAFAGARD
jgi:hypothetical protein